MPQPPGTKDFSEVIAESFGANATYVESLLARFRSDPALVDESWQAYFEELLGNGQPREAIAEKTTPVDDGKSRPDGAAAAKAKKSEPLAVAGGLKAGTEATSMRGGASKLVE